eukprot:9570551-Alexandrium_andersonii.AAC.1
MVARGLPAAPSAGLMARKENTCSESVGGSVVRTVSESCVVLRVGAGGLVVGCGTSARISEARKFGAQRVR